MGLGRVSNQGRVGSPLLPPGPRGAGAVVSTVCGPRRDAAPPRERARTPPPPRHAYAVCREPTLGMLCLSREPRETA